MAKKNVTSIFMVPPLKIGREELKNNNFINAFIKDENQEVPYDNAAYLLFKPLDLDIFREFVENQYDINENLIEDYNYSPEEIILVYKLDPKFKKDFDLIKMGKYSKTSSKFQELFPKVIKVVKNNITRNEISLQYRIFNRTEDLISFWEDSLGVNFNSQQEVWHEFNYEKEVLKNKKYDYTKK